MRRLSAGERESVYRHGIRAVECVLGRGVGAHGLCKMGGGDWNDGMDKVGSAGRGESVWLTWFAVLVLRRFATVCEAMNEPDRAGRYRSTAGILSESAQQCWDGAWFLRGYFDSGAPLGGSSCPECQIDSISQSFAALACGDHPRVRQALEHAQALLMDEESGTVALLDPPFDGKGPDPGYIADYRPGNRENGGQYTHAAVWLAFGLVPAGRGGSGMEHIAHPSAGAPSYGAVSGGALRPGGRCLPGNGGKRGPQDGAGTPAPPAGTGGWPSGSCWGFGSGAGCSIWNQICPPNGREYRAAFRLDGGRLEIEVAYGVEKSHVFGWMRSQPGDQSERSQRAAQPPLGNSSKKRVRNRGKSCIIKAVECLPDRSGLPEKVFLPHRPGRAQDRRVCCLTTEHMELMPGVCLTVVRTKKFKSSHWSLRLLAPLRRETAALNALLPFVLRRGTAQLPDLSALVRRTGRALRRRH